MTHKEKMRWLSHLPRSTPVALARSLNHDEDILGRYDGLTLSEGEDIITVRIKGGKASMKVVDMISITVVI